MVGAEYIQQLRALMAANHAETSFLVLVLERMFCDHDGLVAEGWAPTPLSRQHETDGMFRLANAEMLEASTSKLCAWVDSAVQQATHYAIEFNSQNENLFRLFVVRDHNITQRATMELKTRHSNERDMIISKGEDKDAVSIVRRHVHWHMKLSAKEKEKFEVMLKYLASEYASGSVTAVGERIRINAKRMAVLKVKLAWAVIRACQIVLSQRHIELQKALVFYDLCPLEFKGEPLHADDVLHVLDQFVSDASAAVQDVPTQQIKTVASKEHSRSRALVASQVGGWAGAGGTGKDDDFTGTCYNCGKTGHMSRDCRSPKSTDDSKMECYNCHEIGHRSADCPEPQKGRGGGGGRGKGRGKGRGGGRGGRGNKKKSNARKTTDKRVNGNDGKCQQEEVQ